MIVILTLLRPFYSQNRSSGVSYQRAAGTPKGARDASSPKVVVSTKSYKAKTHRQRTFFFADFQGVQKGPPGETLLSLLLSFYSQDNFIGSLFVTFEAFL